MAATIFEFGEFRLDCDRFELCRGGHNLKLERKPMELLILLATSNGHLVTRSEIAERLWGSEVFVDTEHGINTAVRKIRQALRDDPDQPRFLQTVTGKGYRFIASPLEDDIDVPENPTASSNGHPTNLVAEEPVPVEEGELAREPAPASIHKPTVWPWLLLCAVLAAGSVFVIRGMVHLRAAKGMPAIQSLAVLPLDNLSGDPSQDYLADGMTDELTTMLAKNSTLRVISRTSVMQYKGVHRPLREIAERLGVDGILEGSIARSGDQVHLNIQLIQASTDTHLWAESYDRSAKDMVSLPLEAAATIAKRLNRSVVAPATKLVNPDAHDAYLHAMYLWYRGQYQESYPYFRKAVEIQPDYGLGWAGLGFYYGARADGGDADLEGLFARGEAASIKALQLDDSLPQAHLAMSAFAFMDQRDWAKAESEIQRAMQLDPEFAEAPHYHAKELLAWNRPQEAIAEQKKAMALDAFSRPWAMGMVYNMARRYDDAIADAQARLVSLPHDEGLLWVLSNAYRCKGMQKESVEAEIKMLEALGDKVDAGRVRQAYRQGGYQGTLFEHLAHTKQEASKQFVAPYDLALAYAQLGRREETLNQLEASFRHREAALLWVQTEPAFDFVHGDDRYRAIIKGIGLPPAY
jgi:TolB-like protein/DNA-binding winged helix-turn-helix (wHTH) protein